MNKSEFGALLSYLKNRPEEAQRLRKVLDLAAEDNQREERERWLTATEAGEMIGKSSKWVREHLDLFTTAKQVARTNGFAWVMQAQDVRQSYDIYIRTNHR